MTPLARHLQLRTVTNELISSLRADASVRSGQADASEIMNRYAERLQNVMHLPVDGHSQFRQVDGPGTELKRLLALVGITAAPTCSCNARARTMDANGCEWCEANLDEIVGWLREEAGKRNLPFVDMAGRVLVRRAIRNARKEQARAEAKEGQSQGPAVR